MYTVKTSGPNIIPPLLRQFSLFFNNCFWMEEPYFDPKNKFQENSWSEGILIWVFAFWYWKADLLTIFKWCSWHTSNHFVVFTKIILQVKHKQSWPVKIDPSFHLVSQSQHRIHFILPTRSKSLQPLCTIHSNNKPF